MRAVLDSTVLFTDIALEGDIFVTSSVIDELHDIRSKSRLEALLAQGLQVRDPGNEALVKVREAALRSGDLSVLSDPDIDILALALQEGCDIATDDFAIQNVAMVLGISVIPIQQRSAKPIRWRFRCTGCGRYYDRVCECPVCGSPVKRKLK